MVTKETLQPIPPMIRVRRPTTEELRGILRNLTGRGDVFITCVPYKGGKNTSYEVIDHQIAGRMRKALEVLPAFQQSQIELLIHRLPKI